MKVKFDDHEIELTDTFIESVKNLMANKILMMRIREPEFAECWVIGACKIKDLAESNGLSFQYGSVIDTYVLNDCHISVTIPL